MLFPLFLDFLKKLISTHTLFLFALAAKKETVMRMKYRCVCFAYRSASSMYNFRHYEVSIPFASSFIYFFIDKCGTEFACQILFCKWLSMSARKYFFLKNRQEQTYIYSVRRRARIPRTSFVPVRCLCAKMLQWAHHACLLYEHSRFYSFRKSALTRHIMAASYLCICMW